MLFVRCRGQAIRKRAPKWWLGVLGLAGSRFRVNPGVDIEINPKINPTADDLTTDGTDDAAMTTTDYLINGLFVLIVLRQARERALDRRSVIVPLVLVFFVAQMYLHTIPTSGNDVPFIAVLAAAGIAFGLLSGFATHVRAAADGFALARVGWLAGTLLAAGIGSRMAFAFAIGHGAEPAVRAFSISHQISAAAWPTALVAMAIAEVTTRLATVQLRGRRALTSTRTLVVA